MSNTVDIIEVDGTSLPYVIIYVTADDKEHTVYVSEDYIDKYRSRYVETHTIPGWEADGTGNATPTSIPVKRLTILKKLNEYVPKDDYERGMKYLEERKAKLEARYGKEAEQ